MGSDRARRSYDAGRMYRSVVSQQGRVTLEADANEAEEVRADESRAELVDIVGPTGAPDDGFRIAVPGTGAGAFDFAIGRGTLYVGGVRVHQDDEAATYLGQQQAEWIDYPAGAPAAYPTNTTPFTEAVYLTVTEQEVSAVEDEALREVALGGPDTAARTRMIQRVHRVPVVASDCEGAFATLQKYVYAPRAAFDPATMRIDSTMRLRVDFVPAPGPADACQPTAQTGFLGPENQLIRVQVNGAGTMLWGWDNASFLYRAELTDGRTLKLEGIPVDVYHRPRANQWVELLGTAVDLGGRARIAAHVGVARQVDAYDPDERTVTLKAALPADFADTHPSPLFVRMWENQASFVPDGATPVELVASDGAGTGVRIFALGPAAVVGDYWMIGVRPSTPQAILPERLSDYQPPDGPRRWVAPLAVISWHAGLKTADVIDCRPPFLDLVELTRRKSGCCDIAVAPGEDIQKAIDSLPPDGGSVCLKAGIHEIRAALRIDKSGVVLHGESPGTVVSAAPPAAAGVVMIDIRNPDPGKPLDHVTVQDIRFVVRAAATGIVGGFVRIERCVRARILRCDFISATDPASFPAFGAIMATGCRDLTVTDSVMEGMYYGLFASASLGLVDVRRNTIRGLSWTYLITPIRPIEFSLSPIAILIRGASAGASSRVEHNQTDHFGVGVILGPNLAASSISGNTIRRSLSAIPVAPIPQMSDKGLMAYVAARTYAIQCASSHCSIRRNRIDLRSSQWGGIASVGFHTSVDANVIDALALDEADPGRPAGIFCWRLSDFEGAHHALVRDNILTGAQAGITIAGCNDVEISRNHIDGAGRALYGVRLEDVSGAVVADNQIRQTSLAEGDTHAAIFAFYGDRNRIEGNCIRECSMGIFARREADLEVVRNGVEAAGDVGIWVLDFRGSAAICDNRVANSGFRGSGGLGISADAWENAAADSHLRLVGCEVIDTGIAPGGKFVATGSTIGIGGNLFACQVVGNRVGYTAFDLLDPTQQHLAISLLGPAPQGDQPVGHALVTDNTFAGRSATRLVVIWKQGGVPRRFAKVTFSNNVCHHRRLRATEGDATVMLSGGHLIAMGNHIEADDPRASSMDLDYQPKVALMGNVTSGPLINVDPAAVPAPYTDFNVQV